MMLEIQNTQIFDPPFFGIFRFSLKTTKALTFIRAFVVVLTGQFPNHFLRDLKKLAGSYLV